jgi:homeobox protein cut-like
VSSIARPIYLFSMKCSRSPSTPEFKKQPDDAEKFNSIKVLLKAYQGEIDSLTRRSKMSETSFLNVYKLLADAPDPYPLLDAAVDQTVKVAEARMLESELGRLRLENAELRKQVGEMPAVEEKRKKAENRAEQLEEKVGTGFGLKRCVGRC